MKIITVYFEKLLKNNIGKFMPKIALFSISVLVFK